MSISFTSGMLENWVGDVITIYDGPNATGPILGTINGDVTGNAFTATNPDGCISMHHERRVAVRLPKRSSL